MIYLVLIYLEIGTILFLLGLFTPEIRTLKLSTLLKVIFWLYVCLVWPIVTIKTLIEIYKEDHSQK